MSNLSQVDSDLSQGDRVCRVFGKVFGSMVEYRPDLERAQEPCWTSLKHVEFIVALEGEFGIRLDGADATDMTGIPAACVIVQRRLG
jgi:hypothetical protein